MAYHSDLSDFLLESRLSYFRASSVSLLFVCFVGAAGCYCFDLIPVNMMLVECNITKMKTIPIAKRSNISKLLTPGISIYPQVLYLGEFLLHIHVLLAYDHQQNIHVLVQFNLSKCRISEILHVSKFKLFL